MNSGTIGRALLYVFLLTGVCEAAPLLPPPVCTDATMDVYTAADFVCTINDLLFSTFTYTDTPGDGNTAVPASSVFVTPIPSTVKPGFLFNGPWTATTPNNDPFLNVGDAHSVFFFCQAATLGGETRIGGHTYQISVSLSPDLKSILGVYSGTQSACLGALFNENAECANPESKIELDSKKTLQGTTFFASQKTVAITVSALISADKNTPGLLGVIESTLTEVPEPALWRPCLLLLALAYRAHQKR